MHTRRTECNAAVSGARSGGGSGGRERHLDRLAAGALGAQPLGAVRAHRLDDRDERATLGGQRVVSISTDGGYKYTLEDGSWLLIRFSGTEPLLRIYTETRSAAAVSQILDEGRKLAGM